MTAWDVFVALFTFVEATLIIYVAAINVVYLFLTIVGFFAMRFLEKSFDRGTADALLKSPLLPSVSVLAPAFNESATIRESVRAMLGLRYPSHEVIVINDGSKDDTLQILIDEFRLYRSGRVVSGSLPTKPIRGVYESRDPIRLLVIDKENGGKADSQNAAINFARADLLCIVDSDSLMEENALLYVVKPFLEDPQTIATGGIIRVVNGCTVEGGRVVDVRTPRSWLPLFQAVEYLRAFLGGRVAWSFLNALMIVSGAFGVFKREVLVEAGGFSTTMMGEDMEMVVRLHKIWRRSRKPYKIVFVPEPVCWTEVPETAKVLAKQRNRWQRGTVDTIALHPTMLFNPRYGTTGMLSLPYFFLFEMLGPAVELLGYILTTVGLIFGLIRVELAFLFLLVSILFGILLSMSSVVLEELTQRRYPRPSDLARLFAASVVENLGFRQAMTIWRSRALLDSLLKTKQTWGAMERRGFSTPGRP